jgi:D-alanyl-D-alanine carboxypeptidase
MQLERPHPDIVGVALHTNATSLMKRTIASAVFLISASAAFAQESDKASQVDSLMARWSAGHNPGAAVVVIHNGTVLHARGYGLSSLQTGERISPTTVFDLASVSKQFTAMATMMLVERGQLHYADSLSAFFPDFKGDARQITVRQLLNHTSGIMDYTTVWGETRRLASNTPRTNDNVVRFLANQRLRFRPGARWEYSNSNYVLLGQIVSKMSGEPFATFVREHIFEPLGMNNSFVFDGTNRRGEPGTGYVARGNGFKPADRNPDNYVTGDGQVNSTIEDLVKWDHAFDTEKLVPVATLREAFRPGQLNDGTPVSYGFGWGLGRFRGTPVVSHGGETDGFVAQITRIPEHHFTVIVLSNSEQFPAPHAVANKIADIYLVGDLKAPAAAPLALTRQGDYVGRYTLYDLELNISVDKGALWLAAPGQNRIMLIPVTSDDFLIDGSQGASSVGFSRNVRGQVTCLTLLDQNGTMLCRQ